MIRAVIGRFGVRAAAETYIMIEILAYVLHYSFVVALQ